MKKLTTVLLLVMLAATILVGCSANNQSAQVSSPGQSGAPTPTASPVPEVTEEFKAEQPNTWSEPVFVVGNPKLTEITTQSNALTFTLKDNETYVYRFYDKQVYDNVVVSATVTNLGDNANGIALICRASGEGWYELRVSSGGTYEVFLYSQKIKDQGQNPYKLLASGGSGLIGAKSNDLQFSCNGSSLSILSGGKEIKPKTGPIEDSTFTNGKVGVGVMSFSRVPIKVGFDKVSIAKPQ
jgi:hypothetical protein